MRARGSRVSRGSTASTMVISSAAGASVTYVKPLVKARTEKDMENMKKDISMDDHMLPLKQLVERYKTDVNKGLDCVQAGELLKMYGPNCLVPSESKSQWIVLAEFIFGGFASLLWVGAILSVVGYLIAHYKHGHAPQDQLYLAAVLLFVILLTGFFGFYQESVNAAIMDSFKKMIPKYATVIREGKAMEIFSEELVLGDVVQLQSGECVPADVRIIFSKGLKVDNSSITGESEMQPRGVECTDQNPLETQNLAFYGTNIVEGSGKGIVIATGDNTLMGHIAGLTSGLHSGDMPIKKELSYFTKLLTFLAVGVGCIVFITSLAMGYDFFQAFMFLIAIIVANVPEGILVTLTACLTLTAKRMSQKNCLVKNLQAIEALGSTSVICSDKTGTLTQNHMTVAHMFYDGAVVDVLGVPEAYMQQTHGFKLLCRVGILCNRAEFKPGHEKIPVMQRQVIGDASESGVLKAMELFVGDVMKHRLSAPKVCEIPFNSTNKYQVSVHFLKNRNTNLLVMKGAPERILDACATYFDMGETMALDDAATKHFKNVILQLGYMGERVLGFADMELPEDLYPADYPFNSEDLNFPLTELRFVGFMSMIDPPRQNVPDAVAKCRTAGIRVIMVTGDHPITAAAIAKKVGIIGPTSETPYDIAMKKNISESKLTLQDREQCSACVVTGAHLRIMSQDEIDEVLVNHWEIVFARTSPQQKLKIVESLQRLGYIVAVTGDGVNDSPALKKADIGIAMGITGSDVSKEAADLILLDDNFASIVTGVEEGRLIFDNLKKSIFYVLTSNVPEVVPFILFITINIPQALSVLSILLIDVGTDVWPGISLAYEKPEADIMNRSPRNPDVDTLVNPRLVAMAYCQIGVIQSCAAYVSWFFMMAQYGFFYDRLLGIRAEWDAPFVNDLKDSYGQEWTYEERKILERKGYAAFFLAIVMTQIADAIIVKTRRLSLLEQGMSNWVLNTGLIFECLLAVFTVYCPGVNTAMQFEPVNVICLLPCLPFAVFIILWDEFRRYFVRNYPNGWFARETYY